MFAIIIILFKQEVVLFLYICDVFHVKPARYNYFEYHEIDTSWFVVVVVVQDRGRSYNMCNKKRILWS